MPTAGPRSCWAGSSGSSAGSGATSSSRPRSSGAATAPTTPACPASTSSRARRPRSSGLQMDYVDLIFCHRPDKDTPVEETVRAMIAPHQPGPGLLLGDERMAGRGDPGGLRYRPPRAPRPADHGAAPVQHVPPGPRRERIPAALRDFGLGTTVWSPLGKRFPDREICPGRPRRVAAFAPRLPVAAEALRRPRGARPSSRRSGSWGAWRPRLKITLPAAGPGLVPQEPAGEHGHHRGLASRTGRGEHEGHGRRETFNGRRDGQDREDPGQPAAARARLPVTIIASGRLLRPNHRESALPRSS